MSENKVFARENEHFTKKMPILKYVNYSENGIKIKWEEINGADGYNIYRKYDNKKWELYDSVDKEKKYIDKYTETGIDYQYAIEGYAYSYGECIKTKRSGESKVMKGVPSKVENVDAKYKADTHILLTWNESVEASGYYIYKLTNKQWNIVTTIDDPTVCYYQDFDIEKGMMHCYKVVPYEIINGITYVGYDDVSKTVAYSDSGIDVSHHNGKITWNDVKADGIDFAFIRAGYGNPETKKGGVVDNRFARNMKYARKNGIKVGVYLFSYAESVKDAEKEAKFLIRLLNQYDEFDYPVVYDFENFNRKKYKYKKSNTKIISAFCDMMKKAGYDTMVYSDYNMLTKYVNYNKIKKYGIWVAYWTFDPKRYPVKLDNVYIWQYSDKGRIDGINERTDRNVRFFY